MRYFYNGTTANSALGIRLWSWYL